MKCSVELNANKMNNNNNNNDNSPPPHTLTHTRTTHLIHFLIYSLTNTHTLSHSPPPPPIRPLIHWHTHTYLRLKNWPLKKTNSPLCRSYRLSANNSNTIILPKILKTLFWGYVRTYVCVVLTHYYICVISCLLIRILGYIWKQIKLPNWETELKKITQYLLLDFWIRYSTLLLKISKKFRTYKNL